jgi:hypothetical protein
MRPPSSQQANLSGVGLGVGAEVADGVQVAVKVGVSSGVLVKTGVGYLVSVGARVAARVCCKGSACAQADTNARRGTIKSKMAKRDK